LDAHEDRGDDDDDDDEDDCGGFRVRSRRRDDKDDKEFNVRNEPDGLFFGVVFFFVVIPAIAGSVADGRSTSLQWPKLCIRRWNE